VKLSSVASDVLGRSGRRHARGVGGRQPRPCRAGRSARGKLRTKLPQLKPALTGRFGAHHALLVSEVLSLPDYLDESIQRLSAEIDRVIAPFAEQRDRLMTAPGFDRRIAEGIIGEIGVGHVSLSLLRRTWHLGPGCAPGRHESAGKARYGDSWLQRYLTMAAMAAARTKGTYSTRVSIGKPSARTT
jgi:transposase